MSSAASIVTDEMLIAKIREEKMKELLSASMNVEGTEPLEAWVKTINKNDMETLECLKTFSAEIKKLLHYTPEPSKKAPLLIVKPQDPGEFGDASGLFTGVEREKYLAKKASILTTQASAECEEAWSKYERELEEYRQKAVAEKPDAVWLAAWAEYEQEIESYKKTKFYVYQTAVLALIIHDKKEPMLTFLKENPDIAQFLKNNIDRLKKASESFFEFSKKERAYRKMTMFHGITENPKTGKIRKIAALKSVTRAVKNKPKTALSMVRQSLLGYVSSDRASLGDRDVGKWLKHLAMQNIATANWIFRGPLKDVIQPIDIADIAYNYRTKPFFIEGAITIARLQTAITTSRQASLTVIKSETLSRKIPNNVWHTVLGKHIEINHQIDVVDEDFVDQLLEAMEKHPHLSEMVSRMPYIELHIKIAVEKKRASLVKDAKNSLIQCYQILEDERLVAQISTKKWGEIFEQHMAADKDFIRQILFMFDRPYIVDLVEKLPQIGEALLAIPEPGVEEVPDLKHVGVEKLIVLASQDPKKCKEILDLATAKHNGTKELVSLFVAYEKSKNIADISSIYPELILRYIPSALWTQIKIEDFIKNKPQTTDTKTELKALLEKQKANITIEAIDSFMNMADQCKKLTGFYVILRDFKEQFARQLSASKGQALKQGVQVAALAPQYAAALKRSIMVKENAEAPDAKEWASFLEELRMEGKVSTKQDQLRPPTATIVTAKSAFKAVGAVLTTVGTTAASAGCSTNKNR